MAESTKVRPTSNDRLREVADELEAEAKYRARLAREGQAPGVDLGAASGGLGAQRLMARAEALRARAGA